MDKTQAWDRYWASGRLAACLNPNGGNYAGVIATTWKRFFSQFAPGERLLDIGSGNGAVALLAAESAKDTDSHFHITAVDLAAISTPERWLDVAGESSLEQLGSTRNESLPFPDATFAGAMSQYAIEYGPIEATLVELARVLRPGGLLQIICHAEDTAVFAATIGELDDVALLKSSRLMSVATELLSSEIDPGDVSWLPANPKGSVRAAFNQAAAAVLERARSLSPARSRFLNAVLGSLGELYQHRHQHQPELVLSKYTELRDEIAAHAARLADLKAAALDLEQLASLPALLTRAGFAELTNEPLIEPEGKLKQGQLIVARRLEGKGAP